MVFNRDMTKVLLTPRTYGRYTVTIITDPLIRDSYNRAAVISDGRIIPVDLLPLVAGKDVWMRNILVPCVDCGELVKACDTEVQLCETCYEAAMEEVEA